MCIVQINACMDTNMSSKHVKLNLFGEDYHKWHQQESLSPIESNSFKFSRLSENSLSIKSKHVIILYMCLKNVFSSRFISWQVAHDHACLYSHAGDFPLTSIGQMMFSILYTSYKPFLHFYTVTKILFNMFIEIFLSWQHKSQVHRNTF